jgi:cell division protein FtsN
MPHHSQKLNTSFTGASKPWLWLSAGLLLGCLLTLLAAPQNWSFQANKRAVTDNSGTQEQRVAGKTQGASSSQTAPPRFEFYTLLPEMEEVVLAPEPQQPVLQQPPPSFPEEEKSRSDEHPLPEAPPLKAAPASTDVYVLQAGSFRSYAQADKRKADLALIGIEATIQKVTIDGSKTWHRVRIGPSADLPKLYQIRQRLHESHIESQLFKVKS